MGAKDTREIGLELGLLLGKFFLDSDYLHYGLWQENERPTMPLMLSAQQRYADLLQAKIPSGVNKILDVGAGTGKFAADMIELGYQVDCVSPSAALCERLRHTLPPSSKIYPVKFENMCSDRQYDLVLFSESFSYIKLANFIHLTTGLLAPGGFLMIADFFRRPGVRNSPIGGGHNLTRWQAMIADSPFESILELDITAQTAPTYDLFTAFIGDVARPAATMVDDYLSDCYPRLTSLGKWKFRRQLAKIEKKYFSGRLTGKIFQRDKIYLLTIYQMKGDER